MGIHSSPTKPLKDDMERIRIAQMAYTHITNTYVEAGATLLVLNHQMEGVLPVGRHGRGDDLVPQTHHLQNRVLDTVPCCHQQG